MQLNIVAHNLFSVYAKDRRKGKINSKLKAQSKSFSYEDAKVLLEYLDFLESNKGKTSWITGKFHKQTAWKYYSCINHTHKKN